MKTIEHAEQKESKLRKIEPDVSFSDTKTAFSHRSDKEIRFSQFLFQMMGNPFFVSASSNFTLLALKLHLPIAPLIKKTIFKQFCGGETLEECKETIQKLGTSGIGAILDFSVEGRTEEKDFEQTKDEMLRIIAFAKDNPHIPFTCLKPTGVARFGLLEKVTAGKNLSAQEKAEWQLVQGRLDAICQASLAANKPIYIDAEESWIQGAIDTLAEELMKKFNQSRAIVYTTLQMYRTDRTDYLKRLIDSARNEGYILGLKMVRGAYMEKENARAAKMRLPSPIHPTKLHTDMAFNESLKVLLENIDMLELCAGSHNEDSCLLLTELMRQKNLPNNHPPITFSQLYGMSDNISYNLSAKGYRVTKYLPFGPVRSTIPYLIRRAQENTAISGQMGKELALIKKELLRRTNR